MKIAIIGAGFSGLATAWTLSQNTKAQVTLYDENEVGESTSGIAAGLLHPFAGLHAKLNRDGYEGVAATLKLLEASEQALGYKPYDQSGILRTALTAQQKTEYQQCATQYPDDTLWLDADAVKNMIVGLSDTPGLLIKKGIVVYSDLYLKGLYLSFLEKGGLFQQEKVTSLEQLNRFDYIVVAMGSKCSSLKELSDVSFPLTKGQLLELLWPDSVPPLPLALNSQLYCVMLQDKKRCLVGSTFERHYINDQPDYEIAKRNILPRLKELYPPLEGAEILDCRAGVRVSGPNHFPFIKQISEKCCLLTGMGSKGLLYHALYAQMIMDRWTDGLDGRNGRDGLMDKMDIVN